MKKMLVVLAALVSICGITFAQKPDLKLPFPGGEIWYISTGYGGSEYHQGDDYYALDFSLPGEDDFGKPILAVASGMVKSVVWSDTGYGNNALLDHGDGYVTRYAHLDSISVLEGQEVLQGQEVGKCGNTGIGTGTHLHFVLYLDGSAEIPEPMSGYTNFTEGEWYMSDNYLFDAVVINYPDFSSIEGLNLVGSTVQDTEYSVLQLTSNAKLQAGACWFFQKQYIQDGFETTFKFSIPQSQYGADGIAFVIQNESANALGGNGGGIGYLGITQSLAVELDTWKNPEIQDPNDNHVSIHSLGVLPNSLDSNSLLGETTEIPTLSDGSIHTVNIRYISGNLSVYIDNLAIPVLNVPVDIASTLQLSDGMAWVGFTSATGAVTEYHYIYSWSFATNDPLLLPDLCAEFETSPQILRVDDTALVRVTVFNDSDVDSKACQARVSLGDQQKSYSLPAIPAWQSYSFTADFFMALQGEQVVQVTIDSTNAVSESNEGNNIAEKIVEVLPPLRPDLTINSVNANKYRGKLTVEVEVQNIGNAPCGYFDLRLEVLETGEQDTISFSGLNEGYSEIGLFSLKKAPKKTLTLRVTVDPNSLIKELDETNNILQVFKSL